MLAAYILIKCDRAAVRSWHGIASIALRRQNHEVGTLSIEMCKYHFAEQNSTILISKLQSNIDKVIAQDALPCQVLALIVTNSTWFNRLPKYHVETATEIMRWKADNLRYRQRDGCQTKRCLLMERRWLPSSSFLHRSDVHTKWELGFWAQCHHSQTEVRIDQQLSTTSNGLTESILLSIYNENGIIYCHT